MKRSFLEEITAEEVLKKEKQTYLDVRMQVEFDEECIPSAVHIPLDELARISRRRDRGDTCCIYPDLIMRIKRGVTPLQLMNN